MKTIFDPQTFEEIQNRLNKLTPASQRQWGTMTHAQVLAHISVPLKVALGDIIPKRKLSARIIGPFFKNVILGKEPYAQGLPTDPTFKITEEKDFETEKKKASELLNRFYMTGKQSAEGRKHTFFGKMTADEWAVYTYKHFDHHLRQFGV